LNISPTTADLADAALRHFADIIYVKLMYIIQSERPEICRTKWALSPQSVVACVLPYIATVTITPRLLSARC